MLISRRGPANLSTHTFPNISLQRQLEIYLLFQKTLKIGCNNNLYFHIHGKILPDVTFPLRSGKYVNPNFPQ